MNTVLASLTDGAVGPGLDKAPTGIPGLDAITAGGLPRGRVTLVAGSAGAGKTLLGLNFLVAGAREHGEPGVLMTFEESAAKVALNVRSLGFDLDELQRRGLLADARVPGGSVRDRRGGRIRLRADLRDPRRRDQASGRQARRARHHRRAVRRVRRRHDRAVGAEPAGALARGPGRHRHPDRGARRQQLSPGTGSRSTSPTA